MPFTPTIPTVCAHCGVEFMAAKAAKGYPPRKFCGNPCAFAAKPQAAEPRFWQRLEKRDGDGCWIYTGPKTAAGYGVLAANNQKLYAHRLSWELHFGPIPAGMEVCHRCDTPACVRPEHLFIGTHRENMRDMIDKGRGSHTENFDRNGEAHGMSKLTEANVREIRTRLAAGERQWVLADEFHVTRANITAIHNRVTWNHVQ